MGFMTEPLALEEVERLLQRGKTHYPELVEPLARQLAACMRDNLDLRTRFCDGQRVLAWLDDPERKPADMAFTAGLERQLAYRFDEVMRENERLRAEREGIDGADAVNRLYLADLERENAEYLSIFRSCRDIVAFHSGDDTEKVEAIRRTLLQAPHLKEG